MRKLLLNLTAVAMIGAGGAYLAQAQAPGNITARSCYQGGTICSDGANCCVRDGTCYNNCPAIETKIDV